MTRDQMILKYRHRFGGMVFDAMTMVERGFKGSVGSAKARDIWREIDLELGNIYDELSGANSAPDNTKPIREKA